MEMAGSVCVVQVGCAGTRGSATSRHGGQTRSTPSSHLDIEVGDRYAGEQLILEHGATRAADFGDHRVYVDHARHPFRLHLDE